MAEFCPEFLITIGFEDDAEVVRQLIIDASIEQCEAIAKAVRVQPYWERERVNQIYLGLLNSPRATVLNNLKLVHKIICLIVRHVLYQRIQMIQDIYNNGPSV